MKENLEQERKKRSQAEAQLEYRIKKGIDENESVFVANDLMSVSDLKSIDISLINIE